ncbi:MAG: hypothetical protein CBC38_02915 [Gammaproteobacteria bacterium TMED78]|nr:MAG: hypothetical protein CBC38_02915 [Gammaproteobacteria bacterium TMED78]
MDHGFYSRHCTSCSNVYWLKQLYKNIKTKCGIEKYQKLKDREGFFNKVRLYWFIFFASIRDSYKEKTSTKH